RLRLTKIGLQIPNSGRYDSELLCERKPHMVGRTLAASACAALAILASSATARADGPPVQQAAFAGGQTAFLGYSVAIDTDTAVVGAFNDNGGKGAAYVFVRNGTSWMQTAVITATTNGATDGAVNDQFGYAIAISGPLVLVAAPGKANGQGY